MNRLLRNLGLYLIFIVLVISMVNTFFSPQEGVKVTQRLSFSSFLNAVENGLVKEVVIEENNVKGIMKDGTVFTVNIINDPSLPQMLAKKGIKVDVEPPEKTPWWAQFFSSLFPTLLLIGAWIFILYHMQGGGGKVMSFGKSRAKLFLDNRPRVTFKDVAGVEEAKEELREVIDYLRNPKKYQRMGARIPKGILLLGPPGTGKTLLARAVAGEAEVPFFSVSGSDFVEMFVGVGAARVRDLFDQARRHAPCIIFIDEIDAVGRHRGAGLGGGHDEREQTLNQLLVEMDGFDINLGIILIAATNRPDILDPALLRPGRFDRHIVVDKPDLKGREEILKVHCRDKPLAPDVDLKVIARRTPGFVGADLANLVNEAALLAARRNKDKITMEEFEEAIDRVLAGPERKSRLISEKEKRIIAYHEAGHALVAKMLPGVDPVHRISIIPRGHAALGYTLQLPTEDRYLTTKTELLNRIAVLLGGRVAEKIVFGDITTGAQNDLERATAIAREMICEYGMSERLGPLTLGRKHRQVFLGKDIMEDRNYSEEVAYAIDQEIRQLIDKCYSMAEKIILENMEKLRKLAETLLEREVLEADDIDRILEGREIEEDVIVTAQPEGKEKKPENEEEDLLKHPTIFPKPA
ncbi:MAG: ATP-dependent metallopeptidase FtsH/Yme1/Tma family protein [Synergistetes bacterium]|nr:MAG: ATP-dependent zinc metalloprotease FtsH [bacterium 42_11]MBC7331424.1 ATP-dependent metallopeptidase FtsH/Yme1/Tma family protein [Synergistota bacterium]MDK2871414.1 cell division protease FtsH [bacterium]